MRGVHGNLGGSMMKKFFSAINTIILVGTLAIPFTSCEKEDSAPAGVEVQEEVRDLKVDINVINGMNPATKTVKTDWEVGDKIFIFFKVSSTTYLNQTKYATITWNGTSWDGTISMLISELGTAGTMYAVYFPFGGVYRGNLGSYQFLGSGHTNPVFNDYPVYSFFLVDKDGSPYTVSNETLSGTLHMKLPENFVYFFIDKQGDDFFQNEKYRLSIEGVKPATVVSWTGTDEIFSTAELGAGKPIWGYKYADGIAFAGILDDTWGASADHKFILFSDGDPALTKTMSAVTLDSHDSVNLSNPLNTGNGWTRAMAAPSFRTMDATELKWGDWNLGATGLDEFGTQFSWGEIVTYSGTRDDRYVGHDLSGDYAIFDVARAYLGADWRMATDQEMTNLQNGSTLTSPNSGDVTSGHFSKNGLMFVNNTTPQYSILFQRNNGVDGAYWTSTSSSSTAYRRWTYSTSLGRSTSSPAELGAIRPVYLGSDPEPAPVVPGLYGSGKERSAYPGIVWAPTSGSTSETFAPTFKTTDAVYVKNLTTSSLDNVVLHPHKNAAETFFEGSLYNAYASGNDLLVLYNTTNTGVVNYTTQDGSQEGIKDAGTVETAITSINGQEITTASAEIGKLQSIFRFEFKLNGTPVNKIRYVRIFSSGNKLQAQYNVLTNTPIYGPVTITRSTNLPDQYIYAGLRFDTTENDPIVFQLFDADGKAYSGILNAPKEGFENGKYYVSTVNVGLDAFTTGENTRVSFSPGDAKNFLEPFAEIQKLSYYYNLSDAKSGITVGGVSWRIPSGSGEEISHILNDRTMDTGVARWYKVTINDMTCLLLPPDRTTSGDIGADLTNGAVTDYLKYIGKGFVLLTKTSFYKGTAWAKSYQNPNDGFYRVNQDKVVFRFGPSTNPTVGNFLNGTINSDTKARVRYIYSIPTE